MTGCPYCSGVCRDADLAPLLSPDLAWLWESVATAADRRGDADLVIGRLALTGPADPTARTAAVGLLGGSPLRAGSRRIVELADLTARLTVRGPELTPGAVAAHALRRRLATRAAAHRDRDALLQSLEQALEAHLARLPDHVAERVDSARVWQRLRSTGWSARLAGQPDPFALATHAVGVLAALPQPPQRADRRTLVPTDPHALDDGTPLAGLVLALTGLAGTRPRAAWHVLGVDCDDLTGGVLALGIHPSGWTVPADAVVTLPPRELARCTWPQPPHDAWVFVTENPSVTAAAATLAAGSTAPIRLLCTVGTPSGLEAAAIARLADTGWRIAVRADFDRAGLAHVRTLLEACPSAVPWRMGFQDYVMALGNLTVPAASASGPGAADLRAADTPWDPDLATAMTGAGRPAFEEALLDPLLADLAAGRPPAL
ncbi:DUF2399 domain-containing protein [Kineosporia sp. A_224]|uniref:DUF2399 domain-containing protein n=1 Tax=Kineosporia sp. A_224 TaxID=1962180 RepID=UPI0013040F43|nr:DUF2399 domain-containing protein [Kineosporia sp. A_224]